MIAEGTRELAPYDSRFHYVEFDMLAGHWPDAIPTDLDAVITSLCIHRMPDDRKQGLFVVKIRRRLFAGHLPTSRDLKARLRCQVEHWSLLT
jgi:hypothetical protein